MSCRTAAAGSGQCVRACAAAAGPELPADPAGGCKRGGRVPHWYLPAALCARRRRRDGALGGDGGDAAAHHHRHHSGHGSGHGDRRKDHPGSDQPQKRTRRLLPMMELLNEFLSGSVAWGVLLTLAAFALGALVNRVTGKAFFNPLLLGAIFVIVFLSVCGIPYADYKVSAAPVNYLLLPATVALAIPLYEKLDLLKANAAAIIAGISVGTLVSLGSALALALALHLTQEQYATLLPKSVTTAISMDVAAELGGIAALTGAIVILTGIVGNLLAETVCKAFHITDPIAKGVGIGTSAHAVGTSKALQMGEVEGAMSGLSIAVAGVLTAVLCPVFVSLID